MANDADEALSSPPSDFIFSCSVCQANLSDIYHTSENSKGLRDGRSPDERIVPKLWLADCCHLFCAKHLEGGGVLFTPRGERPKAPCPVCVEEKNQKEPRTLFDVRGVREDECDPMIPRNWFEIPPIQLDGKEPEIQALRFQYLALVRYASRTRTKLDATQRNNEDLEIKLGKQSEVRGNLEHAVEELKAKLRDLERCEYELNKWKNKEKAIRHYLGILTELARENQLLKQELVSLGYAVPNTNYALLDSLDDGVRQHVQGDGQEKGNGVMRYSDPATSSSRTLSGTHPEQHPGALLDDLQEPATMAGGKRKATESPDRIEEVHAITRRQARGHSRELMPPPPLPAARHSVQRVQYTPRLSYKTLDARGENNMANHTIGSPSAPNISVYQNGSWHSENREEDHNNTFRIPITHRGEHVLPQSMIQAREQSRSGLYAPRQGSAGVPPEDDDRAGRLRQSPSASYTQPLRDSVRQSGHGPVQIGLNPYENRHVLPRELIPPEQFVSTGQPRYWGSEVAKVTTTGFNRSPPARQRLSLPSYHTESSFAYNQPSVQQASNARGPLQPASASTINRRRSSLPTSQDNLVRSDSFHDSTALASNQPSTPLPVRRGLYHDVQPRESVTSPFFMTSSQHVENPNRTRLSAGGLLSRPGPFQNIELNYKMAPPVTHTARPPQPLGKATQRNEVRQPSTLQRDHFADSSGRPTLLVPDTPRDSQFLFWRPDVPTNTYHFQHAPSYSMKSAAYTPEAGPTPMSFGQQSLPSNSYGLNRKSRRDVPMKDDALNVIRGVKSGTSAGLIQESPGLYNAIARHSYDDGRSMFSGAGTRRVVRR